VGPERVRFDEPMAWHTSFRIGGPADCLVQPLTLRELKLTLDFCQGEGVPYLIMGNGTNLLVRDGGIRGVVIKMVRGFDGISRRGSLLVSGAGALLARVSGRAAEENLAGLEWGIGIPGTLGGAVFMNAGAYGGEMKDVVEEVVTLHPATGETRSWSCGELGLSYRSSIFQETDDVILEVALRLKPGSRAVIEGEMKTYTERREARQPLNWPSAGSVFKRPPGYYVGPLIEEAGLKGYRNGDAQVSELHAGFIINRGQATARQVLELIEIIQERVEGLFGVHLETELRVVGEDQEDGAG